MDTERLGYIPSNILPPFSPHFPPILHILKEFFHPDSFHLFHYVPTQYNTLYSHPVSTDITPLMQIIPICTPYYSDFLSWIFTIFSFFLHNITTIVYKYINIKKSSWIDEFVVEWSCSSCAMMSTTDGVAVALRKVLGAGLLMWHHVEEAIFGQGSHSQGVAGNFYKSHCPGVAVAFAKTLPCSTSNFYKILTGTGEIYLNSSIVRLQVSQVQLERWLLKAGPRTSTSSTSLMLSRWQLRNGEVSNKEYDQLLVRQSPKSYRTC